MENGMREIKFRVWDGYEMFYGDVIEWVDGKLCYHSDLDSFYEGCPPVKEEYVMQYTGLKDKNGKEIFCGDILKYFNAKGEPNRYPYHEVLYQETKARYALRSIGSPDKNPHAFVRKCANFDSSRWEVVGNIHEHPSLLKS